MDFKTDALLLRAVDYGENDKMVTLLTADHGKIGAAMKGVKKAGAKLRFAAQPFCFAEYVLAERAGRHTVTSAALHDGFFSLREDVATYYAATAVCEACDKLAYEGQGSELLVLAVTALKELCEGSGAGTLVRFLLEALRLAGYPVRAENCPFCGSPLSGRMRFDMEGGAFCCETCARGAPASESTYLAIRAAQRGTAAESADGNKRALRLLAAYFYYQTDGELNALKEYIAML